MQVKNNKLNGIVHLVGSFGEHHLIFLNGDPITPKKSQAVRNHSPDGFNWGYEGSGPAQLALAILLEFLPEDLARKNYQAFKSKYIAGLPQEDIDIKIPVDMDLRTPSQYV